jgi:hypothetical protein
VAGAETPKGVWEANEGETMTSTITIDLDSITVILTADEIEDLGSDACRRVAQAMQSIADAHSIDVDVRHERVSGKRRGENEALWERLAIDLADEVRAGVGL